MRAQRSRQTIKTSLKLSGLILGVGVLTIIFLAEPFYVSGDSMEPTIHSGERLLAEKISLKYGTLQRGAIIVTKTPGAKSTILIKRIIGLPGEKFKLAQGHVEINDVVLPEPYLPTTTKTYGKGVLLDNQEVIVPADGFIILGDNRNDSTDSRALGSIKKDLVLGRVIAVFYPWKDKRLIENFNLLLLSGFLTKGHNTFF